ncbi:MAG: energy transducer TonB [Rhizobiales bacterium]|nr:energy transducer TonB [Hyphomicrobiales bacterium]
MNRTLTFTIWHGLIASVALHSALAAPFVVNKLVPPPMDDVPLVIELQGVEADRQNEETLAQQMPEPQPQQPQAAPTAPPQEAPPPEPMEEAAAEPPPPQAQPQQEPTPPQPQKAPTPVEQEKAQTLKVERDLEAERVRDYVKRLAKKAKANLVYPDGMTKLKGNATVSFALTADGHIRPGTLTIILSSGKPKLDASALATVRACAPFEPPPREMTVAFVVGYE